MTNFAAGDTAYKVMLYGGDDMDPSAEIEPGDEYVDETEALVAAQFALAEKIGHEAGLFWHAEVAVGTWIPYGSHGSYRLEFEYDDDRRPRWFDLVDGKVVDNSD